MINLDFAAIDWAGRAWLLLLIFTVAVLIVAALRKPCRRFFGAGRAFQLWLLPPLALLASQLPHVDVASTGATSSLVYLIGSASTSVPEYFGRLSAHHASGGLLWLWFAGLAFSLVRAGVAQLRYHRRLRDALPLSGMGSRWPVLRANCTEVGPALVGIWHRRIVLPVDFESHYDAVERELILAHESEHARRRDNWWCLLAQLITAMFWFHPLAWWVRSAFIRDQELACDAAVLRAHRGQQRSYASAMLKSQGATMLLPVGCSWSPRHPLAERIAMLKQPFPGKTQRRISMFFAAGLIIATTGVAYAAGQKSGPQRSAESGTAASDEYQLDMTVERSLDGAKSTHAERATLALCMLPGKSGEASTPAWRVKATPSTLAANRVSIDVEVTDADSSKPSTLHLIDEVGQTVQLKMDGPDGKHHYLVGITPLRGCPARTSNVATGATAARLSMITQKVDNQPARAVAVTVAAKAGLRLVNPVGLDNRLISLNFDHIPAERALHLIADVDGKKATFDGDEVQFAPQ